MRAWFSAAAFALVAVAAWRSNWLTHDGDLASPDDTFDFDIKIAAEPLVTPALVSQRYHPLEDSVSRPDRLLSSDLDWASPADEFAPDERATFHPHGKQLCASGCAVSDHPTARLTKQTFNHLLGQFAQEPADEAGPAFETLVFYGRQARLLIERAGTGSLDPLRAAVLRRELSRSHARIAIRVLDEQDMVRAELPPTRIPLDRRHVFQMDVNNVQPLVTSGTVKRVGLNHLWVRL